MGLYIHIEYDFLKSEIISSDSKIIYSLIVKKSQKSLLGITVVLLIVYLNLNVVIY